MRIKKSLRIGMGIGIVLGVIAGLLVPIIPTKINDDTYHYHSVLGNTSIGDTLPSLMVRRIDHRHMIRYHLIVNNKIVHEFDKRDKAN